MMRDSWSNAHTSFLHVSLTIAPMIAILAKHINFFPSRLIILIIDDIVVVIIDAVEWFMNGWKFKLLIILREHAVKFNFTLFIQVNL